MFNLSVLDEFSVLKKVMVGIPNFNKNIEDLSPVNDVFRSNYSRHSIPDMKKICVEVDRFVKVREDNNMKVLRPTKINNDSIERNNQLYTRDIGFVIGDTLYVPKMILNVRKSELFGLHDFIRESMQSSHGSRSGNRSGNRSRSRSRSGQRKIVYLDEDDCFVEGGDVIVNDKTIFVGIGPRTNMNGFNLLKKHLGNSYKMVPVKHNCVHLDCCFNIIGENTLLISEEYLIDLPDEIKNMDMVKVTKDESDNMLTNIMSIGNKTLVVNDEKKSDKCRRVNSLLEDAGFKLLKDDFRNVNKFGGRFRCMSMPMARMKS